MSIPRMRQPVLPALVSVPGQGAQWSDGRTHTCAHKTRRKDHTHSQLTGSHARARGQPPTHCYLSRREEKGFASEHNKETCGAGSQPGPMLR